MLNLALMLSVANSATMAGDAWAGWYTRHDQSFAMPDVVGMSMERLMPRWSLWS